MQPWNTAVQGTDVVGKADLASLTLFTVRPCRQLCPHCPGHQPWRTTWGSAAIIALWKHRSLQSSRSISPEFALLFQLLPAGFGSVSVSVRSILLSSIPLLFYQYNALRDECTLKMEKEDVPIKPFPMKACQTVLGHVAACGLRCVSAWMTPEKLCQNY